LTGFSAEAREAIDRYSWPGNVRELRNVVERAVALCPGNRIEWSDLPEQIRSAVPAGRTALSPSLDRPAGRAVSPSSIQPQLRQCKDEAEFQRIQEALVKHRNKRSRAARELGISRVGLYKKLRKYGLLHFSLDGAEKANEPRG
jgi:DNA-binding NtrC family response regulator